MRAGALLLLALSCVRTPAADNDDLRVDAEDTLLLEAGDGGYHLWVRKKPAIGSVLITESTADPARQAHSYALRDPKGHPINGDEKRLLDGKFLDRNIGILDSTPEPHAPFGEAFHLFVPYVVEYGYTWSRDGRMLVTVGAFLNLKTFSKPYADWTGRVRDNPFVVSVAAEQKVTEVAKPAEAAEGPYIPETVREFRKIAEEGRGKAYLAPTKDDMLDRIDEILAEANGPRLDLVICLDTTLSMKDEMPILKGALVPLVSKHAVRFEKLRAAVLFYRDYFEEYLAKPQPFVDSMDELQKQVDRARAQGGRELPEAVHEALYAALTTYAWTAETRVIVLIGDAPPHPIPRGKITSELVNERALQADVRIHTIILPP